ncbi:hypothetical protein AGRO_3697 [Agrobacterium sp. ATCC 31749]|uniref:hypothetical protein n=1 Tax=unclassified Agrobacterium TaxID=2632611 RepID=UPI00020DB756|nr:MULTISPECIES: hypothetical protein [unclassified Agrobacterium]EGL63628.1 hypothetical protein AGRO_3697 [Agrobacterium sp. ATCC 31749]QKW97065.1 hypothetical protein GSF67_08185 [Agrobacterium sp. CGMCC 11546]
MIKFFRGALVVAFLAGCTSTPGTMNDVHTGVSAKHSAYHFVHTGLLDSLKVATFVGTKDKQTKYGIATSYLSTGLGWAFYQEAWSFGKKLSFSMTNEKLLSCSSGSCSMLEEGVIELTKEEFETAAVSGFEFKLIGKNRQFVVKVPAKAFQESLSQ